MTPWASGPSSSSARARAITSACLSWWSPQGPPSTRTARRRRTRHRLQLPQAQPVRAPAVAAPQLPSCTPRPLLPPRPLPCADLMPLPHSRAPRPPLPRSPSRAARPSPTLRWPSCAPKPSLPLQSPPRSLSRALRPPSPLRLLWPLARPGRLPPPAWLPPHAVRLLLPLRSPARAVRSPLSLWPLRTRRHCRPRRHCRRGSCRAAWPPPALLLHAVLPPLPCSCGCCDRPRALQPTLLLRPPSHGH